MDQVAVEWKRRLLEVVEPHAGKPLMFSGGMDSATLLAACLELDARPELYTFVIDGKASHDSHAGWRVACDLRLKLTVSTILSSNLERDVREVIRLTQSSRKTVVQCTHPVMYMAEAMRADGHNEAILGTCHIALDGRRIAVLLAKHGEAAARKERAIRYEDRWREGHATWHMHRMAGLHGIRTCEPYSDEPLKTFALALDMAELNQPCEKGIAVRAFPQFFERFRPRRSSPLQIGGGIRMLHESLLTSPLNVREAKAVVAIYNDVLREQSEPALF